MMNSRTNATQIANTAPVSARVAVGGAALITLVLVLITPSPERDECLT
jgi:hypothetical protein